MSTDVLRYPTAAAAAEACGDRILELLTKAKKERGRGMMAVSGGSTPRLMFQSMVKRDFDWHGVELFWVDERMVPPDDPQSNYRMTREALLDPLKLTSAPLRPEQIHRIVGEMPPAEAAKTYVSEIRRVFGLREGEWPVFDVIQRGMGPDMHTASLFPGEPMIANQTEIAGSVWVEKMKQHRVTLLRGALERARFTLHLVSGADKTEALKNVFTASPDVMKMPAQIASPEMAWYVDDAAAALI